MPMLIFRAWATCALSGSLFRCLLTVPSPRRVAPYEAKWKRWESVWYAILSDHALEANGDRLVIEFLRILEESATSWLDIRECYWSTLGWSRKKEASARDSLITKLRRQRQRERQNSNRFNKQNNNSARASRFIVYFFAVPAELQREMTKF